ncbi:hypothetical protein F11_03460 [Rhodospirillum rubrum F11]|uniref:restriction endonuclease n=1 Tax=Rhodospirillum rubrum TaxID=1085 RepID=UPI000229D53B|nr:restriction endonuclease [Rhodospirillum rubrum]AEO47162.1 hypothetical protein F11_03460 [Rhodospirillum rubrum F11]MBK5953075.1 hypothetical protein [Rhodospirillum rubrum]
MKFKNKFEEDVFATAHKHIANARIEHNKVVKVASTHHPEIASFSGPPKKEVDVIVADIGGVTLLISCKDYSKAASPGDVQEWDSVVKAMNQYGGGRHYVGIVICSSGFSEGCEPWASAANLMLIPPYRPESDKLERHQIFSMLNRVLGALQKRIAISTNGLFEAPNLYDFGFKLTDGFEEMWRRKKESQRYEFGEERWISSFSELVNNVVGKNVVGLKATDNSVIVTLDPPYWVSVGIDKIHHSRNQIFAQEKSDEFQCRKNMMEPSPCTKSLVDEICVGRAISSACDWGDSLEFGIDGKFNLRIFSSMLWIYSTENPPEAHML